MPLSDYVFDNGLTALDTEADRIDICAGNPSSYGEAVTVPSDSPPGKSLGYKTFTQGEVTGSPANAPNGRQVTVVAVNDGIETTAGTGTYLAISDTTALRLLATVPITSQAMAGFGAWTTPAFDIIIPASAP